LDFVVARGLRIFPGLIVCVLATALMAGPLVSSLAFGDYVMADELRAYIVRTLSLSTGMATLPGVFEANPAAGVINSSIWTLKYEVLCYAILAIAGGLAFRIARTSAAMLVALALWAMHICWAQPALFETNGLVQNTRYFLLFFGTGVIAYAFRHKTALSVYVAIGLLIGAAVLNGTVLREAAMAIALVYVMLVAAQYRLGAIGAFSNRTDMSYGVYLYSVPLTQLVLVAVPTIGIGALVGVTTILSMAAAFVSWSMIEKPAMSLRHLCAAMLAARCSGNFTGARRA
jgi:peptidoglycan/LPS O-acetylase OafA/YrhL